MSGSRVTLVDVARRAGVSPSTASLAFSGSGPIAGATRTRVLAAAAQLGYAGPDPLARSLRKRRAGVVGVVIGERLRNAFRDPMTLALLDEIADELAALGVGLLLPPPQADPGGGRDIEHEPVPDRLARAALDVLVFATCGADDDPLIDQALGRGIPILGIEGPHRPEVPVVDLDQAGGSRAAARHLADLGHRRIAVMSLPLRADGRRGPAGAARQAQAAFAVPRRRLAGVRAVLGDGPPVVEAAGNMVEEAERLGADLLAGPDRPTAVIAQSDLLAIGVVRAAERAGLAVPEGLSVVGFDGIDATGWLPAGQLTTVEQPVAEKGRAAGRMIAELLSGRTPDSVTLPVRLRVGTTTAPPR